MLTNFIAELKWRGMLHDVMPETEEHLLSEMRAAYMGIDPTEIGRASCRERV